MNVKKRCAFTPTPNFLVWGFTIVELVILIAIISVLAYVFISKFSFAPSILTATRVKLINDIRYAQSLAVDHGGRYGIEFIPASEQYSLYVNTPSTKIKDPLNRAADFIVDYTTGKQYIGMNLVSAGFDGSTRLEFDWRGVPFSGSGSELVNDGVIVISNSSGSYTIRVTPQTGRVWYQ
jgi:type II secretory pathway pseudopilin PulG